MKASALAPHVATLCLSSDDELLGPLRLLRHGIEGLE
eukprot:CAMPEP_0171235134 /NCGR_PEP_ID=MMETSP0790-20130122/41791_1 /TAXON_ID=2925 /ORGANISM="Alexandrium catenella, Strain OF101" /LENGTH=36 /DNA_ID= /DNA_START= /DNA_END= /DNA_ORIENTATION=